MRTCELRTPVIVGLRNGYNPTHVLLHLCLSLIRLLFLAYFLHTHRGWASSFLSHLWLSVPHFFTSHILSLSYIHPLSFSPIPLPIPPPSSLPDAVYAAVQPTGEAASAEVVRSSVGQGEEEDLQRPGPDNPGQEAQDVQLPGVEGPKDRLQEVRVGLRPG